MTYLFWAFAVVWIGLFLYLYGLVRRSRTLERQIAELAERAHPAGPPAPHEVPAAPRTPTATRRSSVGE